MSSLLQEQTRTPCTPNLAGMRPSVSATEKPLVQSSPGPGLIDSDSFLQTEATELGKNRSHATESFTHVCGTEEMKRQSTARNLKPAVQDAGPQRSSPAQLLQHQDATSLPVHVSTASAQTSTPTQLLLTNKTGMDGASAQKSSKEMIRSSADDDGDNNLGNIEYIKVLPCVGAFTAQCALCMKWRLIPSKEQYEEIRQSVLENPFFCSSAASWRPNVSCEEPSDVAQDEKHLWAIDRPSIPVPPAGWERQIIVRAVGASKFADVYYIAPSGRKLRSKPELERFLAEFPEYGQAGVKRDQFSFVIPKPLDSNYCRKRTTSTSSPNEPFRKSNNKKAQSTKLSATRKTSETLSSEDKSDELEEHRRPEAGEKSFILRNSYDSSIIEQVVKGSLPTEELIKGFFGQRSRHSKQ